MICYRIIRNPETINFLYNNIEWLTISKALVRSMNTVHVTIPLSIAVRI